MRATRRHAPAVVTALLAVSVPFTLLALNRPRALGIRIPLDGDTALFIFSRPARSLAVLAAALLLGAAGLVFGRRLDPAAPGSTRRDRRLWSLAPLSLLPLAIVPTILRGVVPDLISANVLFFLPVALLATATVRMLSLTRSGEEAPRAGPSRIVLAVVIAAVFHSLAGWYFSRTAGEHAGDEGHYLVQAESLYRDHDLDLGNNLKRDESGNLQHRKHHLSPRSRGGHAYSWHPFGLSLLLWPAMGAGLAARHALLGATAALGFGGMLAWCAVSRASAASALLVTGLTALSAFWGVYACRALPEVLGATLLLWLTVATFFQREHPRAAVAAGAFCCAALPWAHTRFLPSSLLGAALFVLAGFVFRVPRRRLWIFAGLCGAGYLLYYAVMASMFEGAQSYPVRSWLLEYPAGMWRVLTTDKGVLYSLPLFAWLLAACVLEAAAGREARLPALAALAQFAVVLVTSCGTKSWNGGSCVAGRYLLVAVPLLVGPAACRLDRASQPARWWLAFLGLCSCLTFFLVLLHLPELRSDFSYLDSALPERLPLLVGLLQPLPAAGAAGVAVHAIALYAVTGWLLLLRDRWVTWQRVLLVCVAGTAVASHLAARPQAPPVDAARNARALVGVDLSGSLVVARGAPRAGRPLTDAVDLLAKIKPATLTTRDLGRPVLEGQVSQPRLAVNDWTGRGYRWADLVPPFPSGRGRCLVRIQGHIEGDAVLAIAVRQGSRSLLERSPPPGANGKVNACYLLECGAGGETRLLARLTDGQGAFTNGSVSWSTCDSRFLSTSRLSLPEDCR